MFVEEGHAADGVVVRLVAVAARDQGVRSWTVFALATRDGRVPPGVAGVLGCRQVPRSEVFPALDAMRAEADGWGLAAVLYSAERG